jgi:uncharacterized protein (TIGR03083 family)
MWQHPQMEMDDYLAAIDRDSAAFVDACDVAGLTSPVVSCPEWTVANLLWHLTEVHDFWRTVVADRLSDPERYVQPPRPVDERLTEMFRQGREELLTALAGAEATTSVWTWTNDHTTGWVTRRMAHETAVHLWDATTAAGMVNPLDPMLSSDGIDEFLAHMIGSTSKGAEPVGGSVHLHCGDVPGEWTVREHGGGFSVAREHSKGDCAIRGSASDILLALWRRAPLSNCDVVGDAAVAARFVAHTDLS